MFALYQSGGLLLAVGETIDAVLFPAHDAPLVLNALGEVLTPDQASDFTHVTTAGLELDGELYLRRCETALFDAAQRCHPHQLAYVVNDRGIVQLLQAGDEA